MASTFPLTSLIVTASIALPHIALAHYYGISLSPGTIPEPGLSLLVLTTISAFTVAFIKPIVLNLVFGSDPKSKPRHSASWVASNVQWLAFALLWNELLGRRWPCPPVERNDSTSIALSSCGGLFWLCRPYSLSPPQYETYPQDYPTVLNEVSTSSVEPEKKEGTALEAKE